MPGLRKSSEVREPGAVPDKAVTEGWRVLGRCVGHQPDAYLSPCSLEIQNCELRGSSLKPLPGQGLRLAISDSSIGVQGKWKVQKSFL